MSDIYTDCVGLSSKEKDYAQPRLLKVEAFRSYKSITESSDAEPEKTNILNYFVTRLF